MLGVLVFVEKPTQQQRKTRPTPRFLSDGLLNDCLSLILSVDHGCVQNIIYVNKEFVRQLHPE